jgi:hypothetical protein
MTIDEAVREQLKDLMADLLRHDGRILTEVGIPKQRRYYFNRGLKNGVEKLPPADMLLAALVLLRREVVIAGLSLGSGGTPGPTYSVGARECGSGNASTPAITPPIQMSLLAALDFPPETEATIERAEKKGPHRVELALHLGAFRKVG